MPGALRGSGRLNTTVCAGRSRGVRRARIEGSDRQSGHPQEGPPPQIGSTGKLRRTRLVQCRNHALRGHARSVGDRRRQVPLASRALELPRPCKQQGERGIRHGVCRDPVQADPEPRRCRFALGLVHREQQADRRNRSISRNACCPHRRLRHFEGGARRTSWIDPADAARLPRLQPATSGAVNRIGGSPPSRLTNSRCAMR